MVMLPVVHAHHADQKAHNTFHISPSLLPTSVLESPLQWIILSCASASAIVLAFDFNLLLRWLAVSATPHNCTTSIDTCKHNVKFTHLSLMSL